MSEDRSKSPSLTPSYSSLSSKSALATPMEVDTENSVATLFANNEYTPPPKARGILVDDVATAANKLFSPIGKGWADLDEIEKVKFSFLYLKGQAEIAVNALAGENDDTRGREIAEVFLNALDDKHIFGRRLAAFIPKGGDITPQEGEEIDPDALHAFLTEHPDWNEPETAPTIFNNKNAPNPAAASVPMLRYQQEESTVCYLVAVANAIFYNMRNQYGDKHDDAVANYCLNVNRYMRNHFSDQATFDYIFNGAGGCPFDKLIELLRPFNPRMGINKLVDFLDLHVALTDGVESLFQQTKGILSKYGPLIVEDFKPFKDFVEKDDKKVEFGGEWEAYARLESTTSFLQLEPESPMLHALLVVGVRLSDSETKMGGIEFLVQNSFKSKPFAVVGLDLLLSMGVRRLTHVSDGLSFSPRDGCDHPESPRITMSGCLSDDSASQECAFSPPVETGEYDFARNPRYYLHEIKDLTKVHVFIS